MTISYTLVPQPLYIMRELDGDILAGGFMRASRFLNPTQAKAVYQDAAGTLVWPTVPIPGVGGNGGIAFDADGMQGPFFWQFDTANPQEAYFLEFYDANGNLVYDTGTIPFGPGIASGGGGGSIITTAINIQNLLVNGQFWRHVGQDGVPFTPGIQTTLAPGAHVGLVANGLSSSSTQVNAAPDICFVKSNLTATDSLTFEKFLLNEFPFIPDVTPTYYLKASCTVAGTDTNKALQIPISSQVHNLSQQTVTVQFFGRGNSGTTDVILQFVQFFGDGSAASAPVITPIGTFNLSSGFTSNTITASIPNTTGKTLGQCGNDGLFLQIQYPLSATFDIDIAMPRLFLGSIIPMEDVQLNDQIEAIINDSRTGDVRTSLNNFTPFGWVPMNDGTIGNTSSGATTRQDIDTFPLFSLLWNTFNTSQALAPMFTSGGVPVAYGASAIDDFEADRRITLTKAAGRLFANIGTPSANSVLITGGSNTGTVWTIGETTGNERHTQQTGEVGSHTHTGTLNYGLASFGSSGGNAVSPDFAGAQPLSIAANAAASPMNIQNPVTYMNMYMKL